MYDPTFLMAERLMDMNMEEAEREVEGAMLARQAAAGKQGRLHRASRWLLSRLGNLLVAAGERLVEYALPRSTSVGRLQDV